jgi:hypothetical protein
MEERGERRVKVQQRKFFSSRARTEIQSQKSKKAK